MGCFKMRIVFFLLFFLIKLVAAQEEGFFYYEAQNIYAASTATRLPIDSQLFSGVRNYLIQAHYVAPGQTPAFRIGFSNGLLQISRTAIPNVNFEGSGLTNIHEKNLTANCGFCDLSDLTLRQDDWSRSVFEQSEGQTINYFGKNYQTNGDTLEYTCVGFDFYNTIFQGTSLLVFKALQTTDSSNPIFSLMAQPYDPAYIDRDLSGSIFAGAGGAFISGVVEFGKTDGVRGCEPSNPYMLISAEQVLFTVKGSKAT